ncbi:uncharacterized protein [Vicugna pacos]|uniref:Uncharacterized protein n=1 Tax=Vicugna pacos TaxID=30538 RepID=A0ABM5CYA8_VICPA
MASLQIRRQSPWTRSWRRELRNFLKSTLALRMFLPVSARFNISHECLLSLVSSTAVSTPVFSIVAEHLSSMCSHLSSIRAARFSASFSTCLPYSRLHQDWASLKVSRSLTSKLMIGRSSTVCPFRFWNLTCELRFLGSISISNLHSFPEQTPKPSSTEGGSHSITLTTHRTLPGYQGSNSNNKPRGTHQHSTWKPTGVLRPHPVFGSNRPLFGKCPVPRAGV